MEKVLKVISLGAGVQSSTMFLMSCYGELPKVDFAVFADTQAEPPDVYDYLNHLKKIGQEYGIPVYTVTAGSLKDAAVEAKKQGGGDGKYSMDIPLYMVRNGNPGGLLRRQCTQRYKIKPVNRLIKEKLQEKGLKKAMVWIGISTDEIQRMKDSRVKYIQHVFPLIEKRMSRTDCLAWFGTTNIRTPAKSACFFCPYMKNHQWRDIRDNHPSLFDEAIKFDNDMRTLPGVHAECFIHRSMKPLKDVDFNSDKDNGQSVFGFEEECDGMCGV